MKIDSFKRIRKSLMLGIIGLLLIGFTASDLLAQKKNKDPNHTKTVKIKLTKDARKNGYKIIKKVTPAGKILFFIKAISVFDPRTKKLFEEKARFQLRCSLEEEFRFLSPIPIQQWIII